MTGGPHLVLVGLMGTGKSTVGRLVAERTRRPFVDLDEAVEAATGCRVRSLFAESEETFRRAESTALDAALAGSLPSVVAAGGGVVLAAENRARLAERARVVWLRADPALLVTRVGGAEHRPLLDADPLGSLQRMAVERQPLYAEVADLTVEVGERSATAVADAVLESAGLTGPADPADPAGLADSLTPDVGAAP